MEQDMTEREEAINLWFSDQSHSFPFVEDIDQRFYRAFKTVLSVLSEEQFDKFMTQSPVLLFFSHTNARVFQWHFPVPRGRSPYLAKAIFMYFSSNAARWSDKNLIDTVGHEVAHVVLGHADHETVIEKSNYKSEKAAAALSKSWGFRPCYPKKKLEEMKKLPT
jgi:hypothetical protein